MTALKTFDTLKSYNALKKTGISDSQAETLVEMVKGATESSVEHLAIKEDLVNTKAEIKEEIGELKGRMTIFGNVIIGFCMVIAVNAFLPWIRHIS